MLVLAGPGSGKTTVITHRIQNLISAYGIPPEKILVITFTRAAAIEMRTRFRTLSGPSPVTFSTFHSFFFTILRYASDYRASSILREDEAIRILKDVLTCLGSPLAGDRELMLDLLREFGTYKGNYAFLPDKERLSYLPRSCDSRLFFECFRRYENELRSHRRLDFEDMLLLTRKLLSEQPQLLSFWQERHPYILIDEFQDINPLQYEIVKMLAAPGNNLFVVGDCDQSIYGFRGSRPDIMLHFPVDYPEAETVSLPVNYRSSSSIVRLSERLIRNNTARYERKTHAFYASGPEPRLTEYPTAEDEGEDVLNRIRSLLSEGVPAQEIAVLYRTNLQPRRLTEQLENAEIPYVVRGTIPFLYDGIHIKPVLAYLRSAVQKPSREDVLLLSNKPLRYLTRDAFSEPVVDFGKVKDYYRKAGKSYVAERVDRLLHDFRMLSGMNAYAAVFYIRNVIGYDNYLRETLTDPEPVLTELNEMLEDARAFRSIPDFLAHIKEAEELYRKREARRRQNGDSEEPEKAGVRLMTFHGSKGLEFTHVFLLDLNETLVPHKKALFPENIEEERRLLYVAMTRARKGLYLSYVKKRFGRELMPSRFLKELTELPVVKEMDYSSSSTSRSSKSSSYI